MLTRRDTLRLLTLTGLGAVGVPTLASCGDGVRDVGGGSAADLAVSDVRRRAGDAEAEPEAVEAVQAFTADLYKAVARSTQDNLVLSPYSVAVALAMTRNGARSRTGEELDAVLHSPGADRMNRGLNALTADIEARAGIRRRADRTRGTVALAVASSLWGQHGTRWQERFLDVLAREYGAGMHLVDYKADAEAARRRINAWTADRTRGRIADLVPVGVLDALTRLVLVNAIHFKAPWEEPFEGEPEMRPFLLPVGRRVDVELMSRDLHAGGYTDGPGWVAARLAYLGRELGMAVVVPDELGRFEETLDGVALASLLRGLGRSDGPVRVTMPRFDFRSQVGLNEALQGLGLTAAFDEARADFSGLASGEKLLLDSVLHEAMVSVDEKGTEAAAATAAVMRTTSEPAGPTRAVVADRPFLFVIHDVATGTPLFIGRVSDPRG